MKLLKSLLLVIHLQFMLDIFFLALNHLGVNVLSLFTGTHVVQLSLYSLVLFFVYLVSALVSSALFPTQRNLPKKAGIWFGLMFLSYSVLFALAQNDPMMWTYYLSLNFPLGIAYRSLLASEFTLSLQFIPLLSTLTAYLGLKLGFALMEWIQSKPKKKAVNT